MRYKSRMHRVARIGVALLLLATPLFAHHGKDFLLVESFELPHPQSLFAVSAEEFLFGRGATEFRDEPSLLVGLTRNVAGEVHVHLEKLPGERATFEAIAPAIHIRLLDVGRLHTGLSAEYEIGLHGNGNVPSVRLILGHSVGEGAIVGNIGVEKNHEEGTRAIYAIGYRPDLEAATSWGIEAQGALRHSEEHEVIVAGYRQMNDRLTVKAGIGTAAGTGKARVLVRTGVVWRF